MDDKLVVSQNDEKLIGFMADAKLRKQLKAVCAMLDMKMKDFLNKAVRDAIKKYKGEM